MKKMRTALLSTAALVGLAVSPLAAASAQTTEPATPSVGEGFSHIATHPQAALQPEWSRSLDALHYYDGKLIAGYGDYSDNTGPIALNPFDIASGQFTGVEATLAGEEILVFREVGGALYAPNIDPRTGWNSPTGYATNRSGSWAEERHVPFVHVYDVAERVPGEMWMVGSANTIDGSAFGGATVYKSTDGGESWSFERQDTDANESDRNGFERYYWIGSAGGKVIMQASSVRDAPINIYDGSSWSTVKKLPKDWMGGWNSYDGPQMCSGATDPAMVGHLGDDLMVCNGETDFRTGAGSSVTFDGRVLTRHVGGWVGGHLSNPGGSYTIARVSDWYEADDGWLYALSPKGVARTKDGASFEVLYEGRTGASSIAVHDGTIYLGAGEGSIHASDLTSDEMAAALGKTVHPTSSMSVKVGGGGGGGNEKGPDHPSNKPGKGKGNTGQI